MKPLNQIKTDIADIVLGLSPFRIVSGNPPSIQDGSHYEKIEFSFSWDSLLLLYYKSK